MTQFDNEHLIIDQTTSIKESPALNGDLLQPGDIVASKYKVLELIGSGGLCNVYKAQHLITNQMIALKVLHRHLSSNRNQIMRFKQEGQTSSALAHSNIVRMCDFGITDDGIPFMTMDLISGKALSQLISDEGAIEPRRALDMFIQICKGLDYAHGKDIIHRDVKPNNIMLSDDGHGDQLVQLVDFGLAKLVGNDDPDAQKLTATGEVIGSPYNMSPEQCLGHVLNPQSDIYSLGCVMYETIAGKPPFVGSSAFETIRQHIEESPQRLRTINPDCKGPLIEELEHIIFRCLAKEPASRYSSVAALLAELEKLKTSSRPSFFETIKRSLYMQKVTRRRNSSNGLALLGLLLVAVLVAVFYASSMQESSHSVVDKSTSSTAPLPEAPAERWSAVMERVASDLLRGDYQSASKDLTIAKSVALALADTQKEHIVLHQQQVIYHLLSDSEHEKSVTDLLRKNHNETGSKSSSELEMQEQMWAVVPPNPDAKQINAIKTLLLQANQMGEQALTKHENMARAETVLNLALSKGLPILGPSDSKIVSTQFLLGRILEEGNHYKRALIQYEGANKGARGNSELASLAPMIQAHLAYNRFVELNTNAASLSELQNLRNSGKLTNPADLGYADAALSRIFIAENDTKSGLDHAVKAAIEFNTAKAHYLAADVLTELAVPMLIRSHDYTKAEKLLTEGIDNARTAGLNHSEVMTIYYRALSHVHAYTNMQQAMSEAAQAFTFAVETSAASHRKYQDVSDYVIRYTARGGDLTAVKALSEQDLAAQEIRHTHNPQRFAIAIDRLGSLYATTNDKAKARAILERRLKQLRETPAGSMPINSEYLPDLVDSVASNDEKTEITSLLETALSKVKDRGKIEDYCQCLQYLGRMYCMQGRASEAEATYNRAIDYALSNHDTREARILLEDMSLMYSRLRRPDDARVVRERADALGQQK